MGIEQFESYLPLVYRFAAYMLRDHHHAQDVAQEVMLRALRQQDLERPKQWMLKVAANLCRDQMRRRKSSVRHPDELVGEPMSNGPEPWFRMLQRESCLELEKAIESLAGREQSVLYLSAFEAMSNPEIASVLNLSVGAVKVALSRARKSVRQVIRRQRELADENEKSIR